MQETAEAIGISLAAAKGRLFHARKALRRSVTPKLVHQTRFASRIPVPARRAMARAEPTHEHASTINGNPVTRKKEMSMSSKSNGNIITEPQATSTLVETGEVPVGKSRPVMRKLKCAQ